MTDFEFCILPGNPPPNFKHRDLYNKGYLFFKNTWERIFNRPNRPQLYDSMGYFRQNYILQISHEGTVIAQTLATHYNLKNTITEDLPFFENFLGIPIQYLRDHQCSSLLSFEFSAVHGDYSERKLGVNLYKVILQLAITVAKTMDVDAVIGHPRRLTKTNTLVEGAGCKCIVPNLKKYGVSVDIYIGLAGELTPYDDQDVFKLVDELWEKRLDTIQLTRGSAEDYFCQYTRPSHKEAA